MTEVLPDVTLDVDLESEPSCQHSWHPRAHAGGPGWGVVLVPAANPCGHPTINGPGPLVICRYAWDKAALLGLHCPTCRQPMARHQVWTLVHVF